MNTFQKALVKRLISIGISQVTDETIIAVVDKITVDLKDRIKQSENKIDDELIPLINTVRVSFGLSQFQLVSPTKDSK